MTFARAGKTVVEFGKHKGETVDEIGTTSKGLLYLDWAAGQDWLFGTIKRAILRYLKDEDIQRDLRAIMDDYHEYLDSDGDWGVS